jgi:hypothetical protein
MYPFAQLELCYRGINIGDWLLVFMTRDGGRDDASMMHMMMVYTA